MVSGDPLLSKLSVDIMESLRFETTDSIVTLVDSEPVRCMTTVPIGEYDSSFVSGVFCGVDWAVVVGGFFISRKRTPDGPSSIPMEWAARMKYCIVVPVLRV